MADDRPDEGRGGVQPERVAFGAALILLGLAIFAQRLGVIHIDAYWRLWPLCLIGFGVVKMAYSRRRGRGEGAAAIFAGLLLLGHTLRVLPLTQSWPLWVVWAGGAMTLNALRQAREKRDGH